jgi:uncharacterized protein YbjQ (UPF0145 family)
LGHVTQQQSLDYAIEELKKQAAKVGANAIVLGERQTARSVTGVLTANGGTIVTSNEAEIVQGIAVWIEQPNLELPRG